MRPPRVRPLRIVCTIATMGAIASSNGGGNGGPVPARPDREIGMKPDSSHRSAGETSAPAVPESAAVRRDTLRSPPTHAPAVPPDRPAEEVAIAPVPFGPGERLDFRVTVGLFGGVGKGSMEVVGIDTVRGHPCYHLRMTVRGGIPFAHVDDRLESWADVSSLVARRFEQDQKEPNWKRHRVWNFFPEQRSWATEEPSAVGALPTDAPLDDVSFLYYVRTLDLEVGKTYTLDRYFRADGNPVIIKILRIETVSVPLGSFETIVVRPIIRTRGLFGQGGEAEVYFTNDDRRLPVMMRSKIPVLGHLNLYLEKSASGVPLSRSMPTSDTRN